MTAKPAYFEPIRRSAARDWDMFEVNPPLAGPWHQMFKQVQNPRHILSELLQNADDAGATEATVRIEDHVFIFEHNGEDFTEDHFTSICRFGYSNKRALHTIGFRGIGFKSLFSLGECVEVCTPTLSVSFDRKRFTEPRWLPGERDPCRGTRIRVAIRDMHRQGEVEKNLVEWLKSPVSLLFFKSIRRLQIGDDTVHWRSVEAGPIPNSEWMSLTATKDDAFLLIRSEPQGLPEEALNEIMEERMFGAEEGACFPPCRIEIVLGAKGQLFVVLPTGVETALPFACNAPFIQDPARQKIKDPGTSPTNRCLLERAGRLAASAMLDWLGQSQVSAAKRAAAYGLFPDVDRDDNRLGGRCGAIVELAFAEAVKGRPLLLTDHGNLTQIMGSVIIPRAVAEIWPVGQAAAFFDENGRPALSQHVEDVHRERLLRWGVVGEIDRPQVLAAIQIKHLPQPQTWRGLLSLWAYVAPDIAGYYSSVCAEDVRIVPVQGKDVLYAPREVVRLGEKRLLQSEADWEFMAAHLMVVNQNWSRFLADQRRKVAEQDDESAQAAVEAAYAVLKALALDDSSDADEVIDQVAAGFFAQEDIPVGDCVRLAQIASKLGATAGDSFRYVTRDRRHRSIEANILFDGSGSLEELLPPQQQAPQLLHALYAAAFTSCSEEEWLRWVSSGRAGLLTSIPIVQKCVTIGARQETHEAHRRGLKGGLTYPYKTRHFVVEDWDFEDGTWDHWVSRAAEDAGLWTRVAELVLTQRESHWKRATNARILQVATTGNTRAITAEPLLPSWVLRLRDVPCLPDTRGSFRKPGDLLRRTPETESLLDVESFLHSRLDGREATRPLLDLLGVRSAPTGPDRLLDCLRTLAAAENPPVHEVDRWYRRLDQMVSTCSTADLQNIRHAFSSERLVLTQQSGWAIAPAVFLSSNEEDVPGAAIIRESVRDLALWGKVGVGDRPSFELAIEWLRALPSGQMLSQEDARRVRALQVRHPARVWDGCSHWLNLAGEWASADALAYGLSMQTLIPWRHLHRWVKQKTADLQHLPVDVTSNPPFSVLVPLAWRVEERFDRDSVLVGRPERKEWLMAFGGELQRVEFDTEAETERTRALGRTLARTQWHAAPEIAIVPYIEGTPAGTPRSADVLWSGETLYVGPLPMGKLAKRVPEEIGQAFGRDDIKAALDYSFGRSSEDVRDYLAVNFTLAPYESVLEPSGDGAAHAEETIAASAELVPGAPDPAPELSGLADGAQHAFSVHTEDGEAAADPPGDGDPDTAGPYDGVQRHPRAAAKPDKPSIIERFARARMFQMESDDRFFHENGSWIGRAKGSPFPWEMRAASGDLVRCYWPKDHCLEHEPLQLESEIWGLMDQQPASYALILSSPVGDAVEVTGHCLRAMRDNDEITLYPASYRLVYRDGR